jgi:hypothetical protein
MTLVTAILHPRFTAERNYAAKGESDTPRVVKVRVSVATTDFDVVNAADHRKFPEVEASHTEICVMVSVAVIVNAGEFDNAIAPADAALNVAA